MFNLRNIFRNRLVIIGLHLAAWSCLFLFPFFVYRIRVQDHSFYIKEAINTLFLIGLFYLNVYVLIPKFFTLKKIGIYIGCVVLVLVLLAGQQALVEYKFMSYMMSRTPAGFYGVTMPANTLHAAPGPAIAINTGYGGSMAITTAPQNVAFIAADSVPHPHHRYGRMIFRDRMFDSADQPSLVPWRKRLYTNWHNQRPRIVEYRDSFPSAGVASLTAARPFEDGIFLRHFFFPEVLRKSATFALLMLFMSGFIKIALEWFKSEKQKEALKVANLNAELKFLKSQINPHFLFNSLNTIYSLAHRRSPETEHALVKLSTILRYMIYQSNGDKVMLENELRYLQDYIDIQRLRMARNIPVEFKVEGDPSGLEIAPMLLIPFVENAFKHGISYTESAFINISLEIGKNGTLHLIVRNSLFKQRVSEKGGVGLNNVLKRLSLLYTDAHTITVREHGDEFIADLKIALKHDEVFSS
ncbi:histidine kinase [Chitinophaga niabensis]|uniref:sensor histidine kinase n=1 Tax=Chitinophaga niabensis TaxID=536979 RepID=UPI0031BB1C3E